MGSEHNHNSISKNNARGVQEYALLTNVVGMSQWSFKLTRQVDYIIARLDLVIYELLLF